MSIIQRRVAAAQAVVDAYAGKPLVWGRFDCARMCAFTLRQLGRRGKVSLAKAGRYTNALGAQKALKRLGCASVAELADAFGLPRIGFASALPADLVALPGEDESVVMCVMLTNGRVLGFADDDSGDTTCRVLDPHAISSAWRTVGG